MVDAAGGAAFEEATRCFSKGTWEAEKKGTGDWQGSLPSSAPRILPCDPGRGTRYSRWTEGTLPCQEPLSRVILCFF